MSISNINLNAEAAELTPRSRTASRGDGACLRVRATRLSRGNPKPLTGTATEDDRAHFSAAAGNFPRTQPILSPHAQFRRQDSRLTRALSLGFPR